jgi:C-terminal peptidase prc
MCRIVVILLLAVLACSSSPLAMLSHADESQTEQVVDLPLLLNQLIETFDLVLANHLNPPTMQQMVQESIAAAYAIANKDAPTGLAKEISAASPESLSEILRRELSKVATHETVLSDCIPRSFRSIGVDATPNKAQLVNDQIAANRYVGIGIAIMHATDQPMMSKVFPGGPASLAGAQDKDVIVKVDGKNTSGVEMTEVIDWIRGTKGTQVELVVRRDGKDQRLMMTRDVVPFATVQPAVYSKSGQTAGIKLDRVSASSVHELRKIAADLDSTVKTVVLDLRSTAGVEQLHYGELLGDALLDGVTIGFVADREGKRREVIADQATVFPGRSLVVVVDGRTSGVLKWIAAALQDSRQGIAYGDPTAAPAVTSTTIELADGSFAVTMPTHILVRANGQPLIRNRLDIVGASEQEILVQQRMGMELARRKSGSNAASTLYPVQPFPIAGKRMMPVAGDPRLRRIVQLQPLIEIIEHPDDAERKPRKKS